MTGQAGSAFGFNASASKWSVANGLETRATGIGSTALGFGSEASGNNSVSIGGAGGDGTTALSVENSTRATSQGAIAMGANATRGAWALSNDAISLGGQSTAQAAEAVAIGRGSSASHAGAVALGADSVTAAAVGTSSGTIAGKTYNYAGTAPTSTVSVGKAGSERTVTNVGAGRVDAASTDAVNGSQLFATNQAITNLSDQLANGTIDLVQQDPTSKNITVAKDSDGKQVSFAGTEGDRVLTGVAKGAVSATSVEAINGSQLYGTNLSLVNSLGGGAKVNPDGTVSGPTYIVGGKTVTNVGDALTNVDGRVTTNTTAITNLGDQINNGTVGLVQQDPTSQNITVAKDTGGKLVDLKGADGERVLTGVADGQVAKNSKDAINGSQLFASSQSVADSLGGGSKVNPDGTVSKPTYNVGGTTVNNVGDAITHVDGRVTNNTIAINAITNGAGVKYLNVNSTGAAASATGEEAVAVGPQAVAMGAGSVAVGNGAKAEADNSVALGAGSVASKANTVAVGSAGKERTLSHVAAGTDDTDAVNVSQLKNSQDGGARYDSTDGGSKSDYSSMSLGGPGGKTTTTVHNVRAGVADTDAVNVAQLQSGLDKTLNKANSYTDSRFQEVKQDAWQAQRDARGGTAAAIAMASMPQAYLPGASMLAAGLGNHQGEQALAIGLSGVTDNGRYVYKANIAANTVGKVSLGVGAGIQW